MDVKMMVHHKKSVGTLFLCITLKDIEKELKKSGRGRGDLDIGHPP